MNHALGNEVVEFNAEFEKLSSDVKKLVDEVKADVQKTLDEFRDIQSSQVERVDKIENTIQNEVQNFRDLLKELENKFDIFKQETSNIIENSITSENIGSDDINEIIADYGHRLEEIEQREGNLSQHSDFSPEKLREELIGGIRMLGERVSKTIEEINKRMDNFSDQIEEKIDSYNEPTISGNEVPINQDDDFASLKESKLVDATDFEIVPRKAISKLTELFKKQSSGVKSFVDKHEQKMQEFEKLLKTYDEENTHLLELLDRRVKRNFLISMVAVIIVILCSVAMHIF